MTTPRTTTIGTIEEVPAEHLKALQEHLEERILGRELSDVERVLVTTSEEPAPGMIANLFGKRMQVVTAAVLVSDLLFVVVKSEDDPAAVMSLRREGMEATDYARTSMFRRAPDRGLHIVAFLVDGLERITYFLGLGPEVDPAELAERLPV